jgi:predicted secreted protein
VDILRRGAAAVLAGLLAAGCGSVYAEPGGSGPGATGSASASVVSALSGTSASSAAGAGAAVPAPQTVTLAQDGETLRMRVGQTFLLALGAPPPDWKVTVADQGVLSREVNVLVVRGAQGIYRAVAPGTTTLRATASYPCRTANPPCMVPERLFQVTVEVSAG